jgi:hypothetical protein
MNSKILAAVTAAVLSACGCASMTTAGGSSGQPPPHDCTSNKCGVSLRYNLPGSIDGPDVIKVNADSTTQVSITWDLTSWLGARFSATGITAEPPFQCKSVSDVQFTCTAIGLQRGKDYKYTVTIVGGFLPPFPWDPWIRN